MVDQKIRTKKLGYRCRILEKGRDDEQISTGRHIPPDDQKTTNGAHL